MEKDLQIWVTYHKDSQVADFGLKEDETHKLFPTHKPAEGRNINHMNPVYSEMVTMWYVWKNNLKTKYVGFEHYRRHFPVNQLPKKGECQIYKVTDFLFETVYNQYCRCHKQEDMDLMLKVIDNRYGRGNKYTKDILESHILISNCCFLMRWEDFVRMCEFMFPLLDDFAALCGISNTNVKEWRNKAVKDFGETDRTDYQTRILSFLAERLISAWIHTELASYLDNRYVAIVHYNTPKLTEAAIRSLMKNSPGYKVCVFDNSDKKPFTAKMPNVTVLDNTKGKYIDFEKELAKYPDKDLSDIEKSNFGSAKHTMSVECLIKRLPHSFILLDSDVLVKACLEKMWDETFACAGIVEKRKDIILLAPFACFLNVKMLEDYGVHYFNGERMWALTKEEPYCRYDTGAWFLEDVRNKNLPINFVDIWQLIKHYVHGSWRSDGNAESSWLNDNKYLWE